MMEGWTGASLTFTEHSNAGTERESRSWVYHSLGYSTALECHRELHVGDICEEME